MTLNKTLTQVADEAIKEVETQDFTNLKEHDRRYHDNDYRGGPCLVRKQMERNDKSDSGLSKEEKRNAVNAEEEREAALYVANRQERKMVEDAIIENIPALTARSGDRVLLSEGDKNGVNRLTIWCKADKVKDEDVSEDTLRKLMKGLGYEMKDYSVMIEKGKTENNQHGKDRKCFVADVEKKNAIKLADRDTASQQVGYVHRVDQGELDDEAKSRALRKYGKKCVNGQIVPLTAEDIRKERVKNYLGIVGDWEGQSNREDKASGEWEQKRLAALKREQEAKKEALSGLGA